VRLPSVDVVLRWIAAVNAGDVDAALAHTDPDVRIVGPRGTATGHAVLRQWMQHAGAAFATRAVHARGEAVVVAQHGVWRDAAGAVRGEAEVATRFRVSDGRVAELERYDAPSAALHAAGLADADAVPHADVDGAA
jgi:hypothetical protein